MRCIIQTYGQDGFINIEANAIEEDDEFVKFLLIEEKPERKPAFIKTIKAMVSRTELKSFYFSEKKIKEETK